MKPPHDPVNLLSLPREVRDEIVLYLITRRTPPPYPPLGASGHRARSRGAQFTHPRVLRYPPLARVNRQLHDEVLDFARQCYRAGKLTPELDIMAKGYAFYSAWTGVPITIERGVPLNISVNLRIFSTEAFRSTEDWPPVPGMAFRSLLSLMVNFLTSGPSLEQPSREDDSRLPFCIDNLQVNVTYKDLYTPDTWPATSRSIFTMLKGFATSGIAYPFIKTIHAKTSFKKDGVDCLVEREWIVSDSPSQQALDEFETNGFQFLSCHREQSELLAIAQLSLNDRPE